MSVKADATLQDMAGYSWSIDKKEPSKFYLIFGVLALLTGPVNFLGFFGIGNAGDPLIWFHSRIEDVSPGSYQTIVKNMPQDLHFDGSPFETYAVIHKKDYPEDFIRHYLSKLPFDLSFGVLFIFFYFQQMFFSRNESSKAKIAANLGLFLSILMIFYVFIYYLLIPKIYSEILAKYPFLKIESNWYFFYAFMAAVSAFIFYSYRKAILEQPISDINSIEIEIS
jgi:hypothetical protein